MKSASRKPNSIMDAAINYANQSWPVFPCDPATKQPYTSKGFKAATTEASQIVDWWSKFPKAMIGVPTGAASGIWVLDIDVKPDADGAVELAKLEQAHGALPPTLTASTPSGGKHLYFRYTEGIKNRGSFESGIDVRGEGGYVIAAGSVRDDGCRYQWEDKETEVAVAPAWLLELVKPATAKPTERTRTTKRNPSYSDAAIISELQNLIGTASNRNNQLNHSALAVGQFVGAGAISRQEAEARLFGAAVANGYVAKDGAAAARATIKSGLDAGERQPRDIPEPDGLPDADPEFVPSWVARLKPANDNQPKHEDDSIDAETLLGMEFAELSYVVPGYVVEGLTVLGGKPKLGKSWLSLDLGIAVATGGKAMNAVECEQGDVIYLALEDNRRRMQDRIRMVAPPFRKKRGIDLSRLQIRTAAPRIDEGLMAELDKWRLGCKNPRLIIIDVFLKVRPKRKRSEEPYEADYAAVVPLQGYASEHRLAVVIVTHTRKAESEDPLESINGTNGITGAADSVLVLARGASGTTLYGRGRDIEEIETAMTFDGGKWTALGNADEVRKSTERRKIIDTLKDAHDELTPTEIAKRTGMKPANVRVLLGKMLKGGDLNQPRKGYYSVSWSPAETQAA
jgi:hypothetical protein